MTVSLVTLITIFYSLGDSFAIENTFEQTYSLSELFKKVEKSVVQVSSEDETTDLFGSRLSSGFVYDTRGHIITINNVTSGAKDLHIIFSDGTIYDCEVIGSDPYSDLAVVLVKDVPKEKLFPLKLGNSSNLIVGETVAAVGNPFGLSGSLTVGEVTSLDRLEQFTDISKIVNNPDVIIQTDVSLFPDVIQTDVALNSGSGGGPLLNLKGEVIGINYAIYSYTGAFASGISYSIPSNNVKKVVESIIATGKYLHPYLGVVGINLTPQLAKNFGLQ